MKLVRLVSCVAVFVGLLLLSSQSTFAARPHDAMADLDAFITKALADYKVPGAGIAVVQDGKVVMAKGFGLRDITKPDKVDENTIFQLASVTKSLTGAAVGTVVDQGKLDWDTPIFNYLPEFVGYDPYMTRYLTLRDLLAMRTGWPAFTGDSLDSFGYDRAHILHQMRYFKPRYSLREVAQYSNPGFFVAGEVAARASGKSWNDLVKDNIYVPLGMDRSGTVVKDLKDSNLAEPHAYVDGKLAVVARDVLDTTGAASSGTSTAADMAKFLLMYLGKGSYNSKTVLKPETVSEIYKRSMVGEIEFSELPPIGEATGFYYGLGVDSYDYAGHHVIEKAGALSGVRTVITLVPDMNAGMVVLANMNLTVFPEAVRAFYLNQLFGIDTTTDQKEILAMDAEIAKLVAPPPAPTDPKKFLGTPQSLVGVYENDYYGQCAILLNEQDLQLQCGPAKYTASIKPWSGGEFVALFPGATQAPTPVTFTIGADGTADSFTHAEWGVFTRVKEKE